MPVSARSPRRRHAPAHARGRGRRGRAPLLAGLAVVVVAAGGLFVAWRHLSADAGASRAGAAGGSASGQARTDAAHPKAPPLARPSVAHPLSVLVIGDSLGEDLGFGLEDVLAHNPRVQLHPEAVGSTGLANVGYYNWPATFASELRTYHPGLVVVFIGANDDQGFDVGNRPAFVGTPFWHQQYTARVRHMMEEARAAGAHVLWVGMPPMAPSTGLTSAMGELDTIYADVAKGFPLVRYLSTWRLFENPAGQFAMALPDAAGQLVTMRDPDGVHLTTAGAIRVAQAVVGAVQRDWHVRL